MTFDEFELTWPPRSGRAQSFTEVDPTEWTMLDAARGRLVKGQRAVIDALERHLDEASWQAPLPGRRPAGETCRIAFDELYSTRGHDTAWPRATSRTSTSR